MIVFSFLCVHSKQMKIYRDGLEAEGCNYHLRPYKTHTYLKSASQGTSYESIFLKFEQFKVTKACFSINKE